MLYICYTFVIYNIITNANHYDYRTKTDSIQTKFGIAK